MCLFVFITKEIFNHKGFCFQRMQSVAFQKRWCISHDSPKKQIYFKELAHEIIEACKSKICRLDQQTGDLGKSYSLSLKAIAGRSPSLLMEGHLFFNLSLQLIG